MPSGVEKSGLKTSQVISAFLELTALGEIRLLRNKAGCIIYKVSRQNENRLLKTSLRKRNKNVQLV